MSFYKRELLNHFKELQSALLALGGDAFLDPRTLVVWIRRGTTRRVLHPQFLALDKNRVRHYTRNFHPGAVRFVGWSPYTERRWPLAADKLLFKRFALENGLLTPEWSTDPRTVMEHVLVKRSVSSFSGGIKGPFRSSSEQPIDPAAGEYYERFVPGGIAKIWYWNDRAVCMDLEKMPTVTGNGHGTIAELLRLRVRRRGRKGGVVRVPPLLEYFGLRLDTVLPKGQKQMVEYRYGSPLLLPPMAREVRFSERTPPALAAQLRDIGSKLWLGIPEAVRANTVFTVDAILDAQQRVWMLEMNSNPFVHPYVYRPMIADLFAAANREETTTPQQMPV